MNNREYMCDLLQKECTNYKLATTSFVGLKENFISKHIMENIFDIGRLF